MKKQIFMLMAFLGGVTLANAQNKKDNEAIKKMCGCYEVTFRYAETFENSPDTTYVGSKRSKSKAIEWVELVEDKKDKIVLQHLLIAGKGEKQMVIKHWRQDWLFQNTDLYQYDVNNRWKFISKPKSEVKGQWTQKVFQVDDSPRYEQTASWVHIDGKSFWESATDAPLARREEEVRSDYNVLHRRNRHEITHYGWLHEQDNDKVVRKSGEEDFVLAQEKGYNTYKKVSDEKCKVAIAHWAKIKDKWAIVRQEWDAIFGKKQDITLYDKVEGKALFDHLFDEEKYKNKPEIHELMLKYIKK